MTAAYEITARYPTNMLGDSGKPVQGIAILWRSTANPQMTGSVIVEKTLAEDKVAYAETVDNEIRTQLAADEALIAKST